WRVNDNNASSALGAEVNATMATLRSDDAQAASRALLSLRTRDDLDAGLQAEISAALAWVSARLGAVDDAARYTEEATALAQVRDAGEARVRVERLLAEGHRVTGDRDRAADAIRRAYRICRDAAEVDAQRVVPGEIFGVLLVGAELARDR